MNKIIVISAIMLTVVAFFLRYERIDRFLWIDEAIFAYNAERTPEKEIIPLYIEKFIGSTTRQSLRWQFIIFSTLSVPAVFLVIKDARKAFIIALTIAVLPLYSYWGSMARPYCIGAFFCILGYRWPVFYIPAVLTTPISIMALNIWKLRDWFIFYGVLVVGAVIYYYSMPLSALGHHKSLEHLIYAKRFWVIPVTGILLNLGSLDMEQLRGIFKISK